MAPIYLSRRDICADVHSPDLAGSYVAGQEKPKVDELDIDPIDASLGVTSVSSLCWSTEPSSQPSVS